MSIMKHPPQDSMAAEWHVFHQSLERDQAALKKIYTETTNVDLMDILRDAEHITQLKIDIEFTTRMLDKLEYEMAVTIPKFEYDDYNITPLFHTLVSVDNYFR